MIEVAIGVFAVGYGTDGRLVLNPVIMAVGSVCVTVVPVSFGISSCG